MPIPTNKDIAEVTYNGVSIPLAESGGGGSDSVFNVEYGVTPIADIIAANSNNKICRMEYNNTVFYLTGISSNSATFSSSNSPRMLTVILNATTWSNVINSAMQSQTIRDMEGYFSVDTVEGALQELGAAKLNPTTKTSAMTQAVGKDSNGALWTEPSGGGGGVSEVFRVTYGSTPFADTYAALQNGKICVTEYIGNIYYCCHYESQLIVFKFSGDAGDQQLIMCNPSNQWQLSNITLGIDSITGLRTEFGMISDAFGDVHNAINGKVSCTDAQVASYGYLKLSDLPVWDGSVV